MKRGRSFNPVITGLITIVVVLAVFSAVIVSGIPGGPQIPLLQGGQTLIKVRLADADALAPHASVEIAGVKIGEVRNVDPDGDQALVTLALQPQYADVHSDAVAMLRPHGLFGPKYIELKPGSQSAPKLSSGDTLTVDSTVQPVDLDQILQELQAPERQNVKTALVELGKAAAGRGTDVNQLVGAANTLTSTLDQPVVSLNPEAPNLNDYLVQNEAFNAQFAQTPLDQLVANNNTTLAAFAANSQQLQDLLVHADTTLTNLDAALSNEGGNIHQLLDKAPATIDKLDRFNDLLSLFGANFTGKEPGVSDIRPGLVAAIENPRSAFSAWDPCDPNPPSGSTTTPICDPTPQAGETAATTHHGRRYYARVEVFNTGGSQADALNTICAGGLSKLPTIGPAVCSLTVSNNPILPPPPPGSPPATLPSAPASSSPLALFADFLTP